jgi:hypothetical protein
MKRGCNRATHSGSVSLKVSDKLLEALIKWKRQLFGVRRPGTALVGRDQVLIASS